MKNRYTALLADWPRLLMCTLLIEHISFHQCNWSDSSRCFISAGGGRSLNASCDSVYCLLSATTIMAASCHIRGDQRRNNGIVKSIFQWCFLPAQEHPSSNSNCIGSSLNWPESAVAWNLISVFHNKESRKTFHQTARDKLGRTHRQHLLHTLDCTMQET